jgi:hypothetical protein
MPSIPHTAASLQRALNGEPRIPPKWTMQRNFEEQRDRAFARLPVLQRAAVGTASRPTISAPTPVIDAMSVARRRVQPLLGS